MNSISITNTRVINFYKNHPDIDINSMNMIIIDMLERVLDKSKPVDLAQELLNKFDNLKCEMKQQIQDVNAENKNNMRDLLRSEVGVDAISNNIGKKIDGMSGLEREKMKNDINSTIQTSIGDKLARIDVKNEELTSKFNEYIGRQENSNQKGRMSENELKATLDELFPTAIVDKISGEAHTCDIIIKRDEKDDILIENKNYKTKVPVTEVNKFISDTENKEKHGIFISQYSPIANKDNFQIDIDSGRVLLYICNVNYDKDIITTAVKIIDNFAMAIGKVSVCGNSENVKMELIDKFNDEYKKFIVKRENLVAKLKESYSQSIDIIREMDMPSIDKFLRERFAHAETNLLLCDVCNTFKALNLKSLNKHKYHCKKKRATIIGNVITEVA
mgnify:FL=1|jgi:hypothetical protein